MFSTEPSRHTQALQYMICLQDPQASLGSLFAMVPKMPHSCRSALWTDVLASSLLSIPKAKSFPGLNFTCRTFESLATSYFPILVSWMKDVNQIRRAAGSLGLRKAGPDGESWLCRMFALASFALNLLDLVTSRTVFSKGI